MVEDLLVCIIGLAVVFFVLSVLMFLIIGTARLSGVGEGGRENKDAGLKTKPGESDPGSAIPGDTTELAAVALAMASYLRQRGRELGQYIIINDVNLQVNVGDLHSSPISVEVNEEKFRAGLNSEDLPVSTEHEFKKISWPRDEKRGPVWRAACTPSQGGYWSRGGWTGRRAVDVDRK